MHRVGAGSREGSRERGAGSGERGAGSGERREIEKSRVPREAIPPRHAALAIRVTGRLPVLGWSNTVGE